LRRPRAATSAAPTPVTPYSERLFSLSDAHSAAHNTAVKAWVTGLLLAALLATGGLAGDTNAPAVIAGVFAPRGRVAFANDRGLIRTADGRESYWMRRTWDGYAVTVRRDLYHVRDTPRGLVVQGPCGRVGEARRVAGQYFYATDDRDVRRWIYVRGLQYRTSDDYRRTPAQNAQWADWAAAARRPYGQRITPQPAPWPAR